LEDLTVDGKFMSNWIIKNTDRMSVDWIHLAQGEKIAGICEHGNDHAVSTKCGGFPDQLRNYQLLTRDHSASLNSSFCDGHGQTVSSIAFLEAQTADRMKTLPVLEWEVSGWLLGGNDEAPVSATECTFQKAHRIADTNDTGLRVFMEALTAYCGNRRGAQRIDPFCSMW